MMLWKGHIFTVMGVHLEGRIQFMKGALHMLLTVLGIPVESTGARLFLGIVPFVFLVLMIVLAARTKDRDRMLFFLTSAMIFFPTNAFRYTLSYLAIPLVFWILSKKDRFHAEDWIRAILYGCIFTIPTLFGHLTGFAGIIGEYYTLTHVELWVYLFAYLLLIVEFVLEVRDQLHARSHSS